MTWLPPYGDDNSDEHESPQNPHPSSPPAGGGHAPSRPLGKAKAPPEKWADWEGAFSEVEEPDRLMCKHCDWGQALTDIKMRLSQDPHILDIARLERLRVRIENARHTTPMERNEILRLVDDMGAD